MTVTACKQCGSRELLFGVTADDVEDGTFVCEACGASGVVEPGAGDLEGVISEALYAVLTDESEESEGQELLSVTLARMADGTNRWTMTSGVIDSDGQERTFRLVFNEDLTITATEEN